MFVLFSSGCDRISLKYNSLFSIDQNFYLALFISICNLKQLKYFYRPSSKVVIKFLQVMQKNGYIGEFEVVDDHRSGKIVVELIGRINKCGVISPRFDVEVKVCICGICRGIFFLTNALILTRL